MYSNFIGVIDSGLGGISVLRRLRLHLPCENFIYFADSENAPYGLKSDDEIIFLMRKNVEHLVCNGCKAIVVACNTATAVAISELRKKYQLPIVGLEPALKPALNVFPNGNILVLATPVTLSHHKFRDLLAKYDNGNVYTKAIPELVLYVESGEGNSDTAVEYIRTGISDVRQIKFDACVLGCTHFPFADNAITGALGYKPCYFDGSDGAAIRLKRLLEKAELSAPNTQNGYVMWNRIYPGNLQNKLLYSNL